MIRITLACAGGYSTSLLINRIEEEAKKRKLEVTVQAIGEMTIAEHIGEFDVLLLGPQVHHVLSAVKKLVEGVAPVEMIDMRDYGTMNGARVLDAAIRMYNDYYK